MVECAIVANIHLTIIMSHYSRIFQNPPVTKIAYRCRWVEEEEGKKMVSFCSTFFSSFGECKVLLWFRPWRICLFLLPFFSSALSVFMINRLWCSTRMTEERITENRFFFFSFLSSVCFCAFCVHLFSASCDLITNNRHVITSTCAHCWIEYFLCSYPGQWCVTILDTRAFERMQIWHGFFYWLALLARIRYGLSLDLFHFSINSSLGWEHEKLLVFFFFA